MALHFLDVSLSHKRSNTPAEKAEILVCLQTLQNVENQDFPDGPVAKTLCSQSWGLGSIPGQLTRSHMLQPDTNK